MIYLVLGVAWAVVKVVARALLLLQKKRPPERDKSPGPPKPAIKIYLVGVISLVRPPNFLYAHLEIVVAFLIVNAFCFLVITWRHEVGFDEIRRKLILTASRTFL